MTIFLSVFIAIEFILALMFAWQSLFEMRHAAGDYAMMLLIVPVGLLGFLVSLVMALVVRRRSDLPGGLRRVAFIVPIIFIGTVAYCYYFASKALGKF